MHRLIPVLLVLATTACAAVRGVVWTSADVSREGQVLDDHRLREALERGRFDSALVRATSTGRGAPHDELLRTLYAGAVSYYAGRWNESAASLDRAAALAEDRYTKSLSKGAAAILSNDRVLPYAPGRTERLLVHYYAMLGRTRLGDTLGAAVEARRLSALLERYREGRTDEEAGAHAALHHAAGAVFEIAGERNDADVAYRNAAALAKDSLYASAVSPVPVAPMLPPVARRSLASRRRASRPAPPAPATGEVVVLLEHGWVAHRVEDALVVSLDSGDLRVFGGGRRSRGRHRHERPVGAAERILSAMDADDASSGWRHRRHGSTARVGGGDGRRLLTVAWARLAPPRREARCVALVVDSLPAVHVRALGNLSDAAAADFRRQSAMMLARAIVRATARSAVARQARRGGEVAGMIASVGGSLLEHADLRSWQLLPNDIAVGRLRLPVGHHALHAVIEDAHGVPRRVALGDVHVREGGVTLVTARDW